MRALLLILPLALVGGLYYWSIQPDASDGDNSLDGPTAQAELPQDVAPEMEEAELEGIQRQPELRDEAPLIGEVNQKYPLEVDLVLVQPGEPEGDSDQEIRAGAKAVLRGKLQDDFGAPLTGQVVFEAGANKGRTLSCAADGTFLASDLYPGLSIVRAESGRGFSSVREVRLGQFGNTELNISFGPRSSARVSGRVQDEFGEPILDATVRVDGQMATTNEEGRFEVYRTTAGLILLEVVAEGYAHYRELLPIGRGAKVDPDRLVFQLEKEALLDIQVTGNSGASGPVLVYLFPAGGQRINRQRGQRTFPWYRINPIEVQPGRSTTVRGLAPGHVTVMGFKSGAICKPKSQNKKLLAGKQASVALEAEPGPTLSGRVLVDGKPAARASVRLEALDASQASMRAIGRRPSFLLEMVTDILPAAVQRMNTDKAGRFVFTTQPAMQSEYVLWATSADGKHRAIRRVTGDQLTTDIEVSLDPVDDGTGRLKLDLPGVAAPLPYRIRVNGEARPVEVLAIGEDLVVDNLSEGLWRLDLSRYKIYAERGLRVWITPGKDTEDSTSLDRSLWTPER